jgi:predicted Rossmann fold nucleotide-binding protein DprA/Smf involved in DNA uptake
MFAVPGNLGVDSCLGSNALLQEGAYPALSGWDVVKHYENLYPGAVEKRTPQLQKRPQEALPKVAQQAALPQTQGEKMEKLPKKSIDKVENSTYSVLYKREASLSREEMAVLDLLSQTPQFPDAVLDRAELPPAMVQSILTRLSIKGLVQYQPDGRISRK